MKIHLVMLGKTRRPEIRALMDDYLARIGRFADVQLTELREDSAASLRKLVLERDGYLCQCTHCKAEFRVTLATEVDHVVSKAIAKTRGWTDEQIEDQSNLAAINGDCHKRKTQEEQGKTIKPKIGLDGWAIL